MLVKFIPISITKLSILNVVFIIRMYVFISSVEGVGPLPRELGVLTSWRVAPEKNGGGGGLLGLVLKNKYNKNKNKTIVLIYIFIKMYRKKKLKPTMTISKSRTLIKLNKIDCERCLNLN